MSCTWRPEIRETIMMISMYRAKPASPEGAEGHHHLQTVSPRLLSGVFKSIAVLHTHYKHLLKAPTTLRWCTMEFPGWQMTMWPQFYGPLMMILFPRDHLCEVFIFSYYQPRLFYQYSILLYASVNLKKPWIFNWKLQSLEASKKRRNDTSDSLLVIEWVSLWRQQTILV